MNDLFIGAGKGIGLALQQYRRHLGHDTFNITSRSSTNPQDFTVDWTTLNESHLHRWLRRLPKIDLVFFNHNYSSLNRANFRSGAHDTLHLWQQVKHWRQAYWVSCQMPFEIIHTLKDRLHEESRVVWMLSSMIASGPISDPDQLGYADYIGNKFQNYLVMRNFAANHHACFLGLEPGNVSGTDHDFKIAMIDDILRRPKTEINGGVFGMQGEQRPNFLDLP